jgi:anti-sigma B factor antagonist
MDVVITKHSQAIAIVKPDPQFDAFDAPNIQEGFDDLLAKGFINFVIDLTEVSFMDSAAMAILVGLLKQTREKGGYVKLVWPKRRAAQHILSLTRFDRVFEMVDSVDAATNGL